MYRDERVEMGVSHVSYAVSGDAETQQRSNAGTHGRMDAWTHGRMDAGTHGIEVHVTCDAPRPSRPPGAPSQSHLPSCEYPPIFLYYYFSHVHFFF